MKALQIMYKIAQWIWQLNWLPNPYICEMKVRFADTGETVEASDNRALVGWMRQNSHSEDNTNKEYMLNYSRRAVLAKNEDIRATNEDEFVADLLKLKHIELI